MQIELEAEKQDHLFSFRAAHRVYPSLEHTIGNQEINRIFAFTSIDVKFGTMRDLRISQSLAEFQKYYSNILKNITQIFSIIII